MQAFGTSWQFWAVLSAVFAALTAILAKVGVGGIDSDLATFIRTLVVAAALALLLAATGKFASPGAIPGKALVFLALSGLGTGASWLCYFRALSLGEAAQVAPVDKLSVVLVAIFGAIFLGEQLPARGWLGVGLIAVGATLLALRA
jgi:transporter family protein